MFQTDSKLFVLFLLLFFLLSTAGLSQNSIITLGGGISNTVGEGSEDIDLGFNGTFTALGKMSEKVYIGGKIAYNYFSLDVSEIEEAFPGLEISGSMSILELSPVVRLIPNADEYGPTGVFVQAGFGFYTLSAELEASYGGESDSDSDSTNETGFNFGVGLLSPNENGIGFEIAGNYHIISSDEGDSSKYFTVNLGILF